MDASRPHVPASFLVIRRLLSKPDLRPYALAKDLRIPISSAAAVYARLREENVAKHPRLLLERLRQMRRPDVQVFTFRAPNPDQWFRAFQHQAWLSGESAAAHDQLNLVPSRHVVYVQPEHVPDALAAAKAILADYAPRPADANLEIRVADPWLRPDDEEPRLAEKGQRLLDYAESKHIQILLELERGVL